MQSDVKRPMRRIVAWEYRSNNNGWGYDAKLECGHVRTDLNSQFGGHRGRAVTARCWVCVEESEDGNATAKTVTS